MTARRRLTHLAAAAIAWCAIAIPAAAQLTTGSVAGTVTDTSGAVIPGATVTLISETRGTRMPDVVTSTSGDFVVPNVTADRYTVQVTMDGFKTLQRTGISVSAGDRQGLGTFAIELGGVSETISVKSEAPIIQSQSGERSFTIATSSVENLPIANRSFTALASLAPGVTQHGRSQPHRRRRRYEHHDGRRRGDGHGKQPSPAPDERRIDCRSEGPDVGLPGRIRTFERPADHRRHQERHQSLPRIGVRRAARLGLVFQHQDQQAQWRSEDDPQGEGPGLFDRRSHRQAGWQQQALFLLQPGILAADGRKRCPALPFPDGARTDRRLLADDRQPGRAVQLHQGSEPDRRVHGSGPDRLLPRRWRARQDPDEPPVPNGPRTSSSNTRCPTSACRAWATTTRSRGRPTRS